MFGFLTKKYKKEIKKLEERLDSINFEWEHEKKLYDENMKEKFYEQKVDWTIGNMDLKKFNDIHRPIYGLTEEEARIIAQKTKEKMIKNGYNGNTSFHWREKDKCFVIDVNVIN